MIQQLYLYLNNRKPHHSRTKMVVTEGRRRRIPIHRRIRILKRRRRRTTKESYLCVKIHRHCCHFVATAIYVVVFGEVSLRFLVTSCDFTYLHIDIHFRNQSPLLRSFDSSDSSFRAFCISS